MRIRRRLNSIVLVSATLTTTSAQAEPVSQVVPYSGFLDRDGAPLQGQARLRFRVYTTADAPVAGEDDPCDASVAPTCAWQEVHPEVAVRNGAFQVRLGRPAGAGQPRDLAPLLRRGEQLHLEVAVYDDAGQRYTTLGRQSISPAPQAIFTLQRDIAAGTLTAETVDTQTLSAVTAFAGRLDATDVHAGALAVEQPGGGALTVTSSGLQAVGANGQPAPLTANGAGGGLVLSSAGQAVQIRGPLALSPEVEITFGGARPFAGLQNMQDGFGAAVSTVGVLQSQALFLAPNDGRHACFLTNVLFTDYGDNYTQNCAIFPSNGNLVQQAQGDPTSNNRVTNCRARCLAW